MQYDYVWNCSALLYINIIKTNDPYISGQSGTGSDLTYELSYPRYIETYRRHCMLILWSAFAVDTLSDPGHPLLLPPSQSRSSWLGGGEGLTSFRATLMWLATKCLDLVWDNVLQVRVVKRVDIIVITIAASASQSRPGCYWSRERQRLTLDRRWVSIL